LKFNRVWKLELVKSCYSKDTSLQKEWKHGATTISEELKGIRCLSTEEHRKRTIVQLYNHYSTTPLFIFAIVQGYSCIYADCSPNKEWI